MSDADRHAALPRGQKHQPGVEHGMTMNNVIAVLANQAFQLPVEPNVAPAGRGKVPDPAPFFQQLGLVGADGVAEHHIVDPELCGIGKKSNVPANPLRAADRQCARDNQYMFQFSSSFLLLNRQRAAVTNGPQGRESQAFPWLTYFPYLRFHI